MSGTRPKSIILAIIIISKRRWAGKLNLLLRPDFHFPMCLHICICTYTYAKCSHKWPNNVGGHIWRLPVRFVDVRMSTSYLHLCTHVCAHMWIVSVIVLIFHLTHGSHLSLHRHLHLHIYTHKYMCLYGVDSSGVLVLDGRLKLHYQKSH